jgi:uncharacterized SAM-binding protein YcdF (DUF218 family)
MNAMNMRETPNISTRNRESLVTALLRSVLWVMVMIIMYLGVVTYLVSAQSKRDETRQADAAIVLGAAVWAGNPSPVLRARLDHALLLFQNKQITRIVVTGGVGRGDTMSEAEASAEYLKSKGVPAEAILLEQEGRSTYESLKTAAVLAKEANIMRVLLVSDPFHMLRSLKMAQDLGLEAYASPTTTSPISTRPLEEQFYMLREAIAYTAYLFNHE